MTKIKNIDINQTDYNKLPDKYQKSKRYKVINNDNSTFTVREKNFSYFPRLVGLLGLTFLTLGSSFLFSKKVRNGFHRKMKIFHCQSNVNKFDNLFPHSKEPLRPDNLNEVMKLLDGSDFCRLKQVSKDWNEFIVTNEISNKRANIHHLKQIFLKEPVFPNYLEFVRLESQFDLEEAKNTALNGNYVEAFPVLINELSNHSLEEAHQLVIELQEKFSDNPFLHFKLFFELAKKAPDLYLSEAQKQAALVPIWGNQRGKALLQLAQIDPSVDLNNLIVTPKEMLEAWKFELKADIDAAKVRVLALPVDWRLKDQAVSEVIKAQSEQGIDETTDIFNEYHMTIHNQFHRPSHPASPSCKKINSIREIIKAKAKIDFNEAKNFANSIKCSDLRDLALIEIVRLEMELDSSIAIKTAALMKSNKAEAYFEISKKEPAYFEKAKKSAFKENSSLIIAEVFKIEAERDYGATLDEALSITNTSLKNAAFLGIIRSLQKNPA